LNYKNITLEGKDGVARLTINRPPLNILNIETMQEMISALKAVGKDESVNAIVITGAGDRAFSAGADIKDHMPDKVEVFIRTFNELFYLLMSLEKTTIAQVNGYALGGGCELAIACDIIIASEKAQIGVPETTVGVFPPVAAAVLPKLVGRPKALELILTGDMLDAKTAEYVGLVNKAVPSDRLEATVDELLKKLKEKSPVVLKLAKKAVYSGLELDFRKGLESITDIYLGSLMRTEDAVEGLQAFLEKRKPKYKGK